MQTDSQPTSSAESGQAEVISFLSNRGSYPFDAATIEHLETHISHVFLAGEFAFKIKKPVKFDFLDFSTLEKRKHFCEEELRLNSRFAPELYLEVIPISRLNNRVVFGAGEQLLDYAIKMRRFDENSLFSELADRGELRESLLLQITDVISRFHSQAVAQPEYWSFEYLERAMKSNIAGCDKFSPALLSADSLSELKHRTDSMLTRHKDLIRRRQKTHVRELHGDLHLKNMCVYQKRVQLFDGIEFNPELSNCDVWADLAFFVMDLLFRGLTEDAALVWNHYLQETDDYEGFQLLDLYVSYRAAIRSRITCLEIPTSQETERQAGREAQMYLDLALTSLAPREKCVIAIGGLAGSGKSTLSSLLARRMQAVHVRSDAVRKHLCGVPPSSRAPQSAYNTEINEKTYGGLLDRASIVLRTERPVIIDAVFHSQTDREAAESFADKLSVPFIGIWCEISPKLAGERVRMRVGDISDADESVLALQQSYKLGEMNWRRLDTSANENQSLEHVLSWMS